MSSETIKEKKLFQKVRDYRTMSLKKAVNGHINRGDEAYFEDLAEIAARKTKMFLLSLPLKKIFREMT